MALLDKTQYGSILFASNKFQDIQDITDHFLAEYRQNINDNPRFVEKLKEVILYVKNKIEDQCNQIIARDKKANYKNPDGSPMEKKDYKGYKWSADKLGFGFIQFKGGNRISMNKLSDIEKAFDLFEVQGLNDKQPTIKQRIRWRGELKEFAELIIQLERAKWIDLPHGELAPMVKTLCMCFDFSDTKKKKDSNTENSLLQYLKPSEQEDKVFTKRYNQKFNSIKPNITPK